MVGGGRARTHLENSCLLNRYTLTDSVTSKMSPNVYKNCPKWFHKKNQRFWPPLQKLPKNEGDLGEIIAARGFKKLPKVQLIIQSGHTGNIDQHLFSPYIRSLFYSIFLSFSTIVAIFGHLPLRGFKTVRSWLCFAEFCFSWVID